MREQRRQGWERASALASEAASGAAESIRGWWSTPDRALSLWPYSVALWSVLFTAVVQAVLSTITREPPLLLLYLVTVMANALYGGLGPGLLTTLLSAVFATWPIVGPELPASVVGSSPGPIRVILFLLVGGAISAIIDAAATFRTRATTMELEASARHSELAQEITGRYEVERALDRSETRFRVMAELVPSCVWTATPDGAVDYANRRWYEFTGITREQTVGSEWADVVHPDDREQCQRAWRAATETGSSYEVQVRNRGADGEYRWFLTRAVPVHDADGTIAAWFGTATDIDEQIRVQDALREADRRKDEFLAHLAHELRNPLAAIRTAVYLLKQIEASDPRLLRGRDIIDRQVTHQARLLDDLLDVARITQNKVELRSTPMDLVRLVRETVEDYRGTVDAAGLDLVLDLPDAPVWVEADGARIAQIVGNLLSNATKFTDRGGRVTVALQTEPGDRQRVRLTVQDTGIGIAPELLPHLFHPFVQADRAEHRGLAGLGLGLALVKGLVDLHGGDVWAESDGVGRGARFTIRLPLASAPTPIAAASGTSDIRTETKRILIVEDHPDTASSLRSVLELSGYLVEVVTIGSEAVAAARRFRPAIVLCDLDLPGMNGYQVAAALRHEPVTAKARLIATTGFGHDEARRRTQAAGFDLHLTKPVDIDELLALLRASGGTGAD